MRIITIIIVVFFSLSTSQAQRSRKFTPVYGNDAEINRTLSFITEHLLFDSLTYTRLGTLEGFVRCTFFVDTRGKVVEVKIAKGLSNWIDYEISTAMGRLPAMEPFKDKSGDLIKVRRDVYFTFNGDDNHGWKSPYDLPNGSKSLEEQKKEHFEKLAKADKNWKDYTKDNTKLSLDGKNVYKPGVLPQNPLKITPPPTRPPISVTIKSE